MITAANVDTGASGLVLTDKPDKCQPLLAVQKSQSGESAMQESWVEGWGLFVEDFFMKKR